MAKYINIDALVAEIERRLSRISQNTNAYEEGRKRTYLAVLALINTLEVREVQEEPVCEDLEVEVDRWYNNEAPKEFEDVVYADIEKCAKHFADWQKQQDQSTIELAEDHAMLAGMEKMKEQMMAKAINTEASYSMSVPSISISLPLGINVGDRVKVIVIKED